MSNKLGYSNTFRIVVLFVLAFLIFQAGVWMPDRWMPGTIDWRLTHNARNDMREALASAEPGTQARIAFFEAQGVVIYSHPEGVAQGECTAGLLTLSEEHGVNYKSRMESWPCSVFQPSIFRRVWLDAQFLLEPVVGSLLQPESQPTQSTETEGA